MSHFSRPPYSNIEPGWIDYEISQAGAVVPVVAQATGSLYAPTIDSLRGSATSLDQFNTKNYATGTKIEFIFGSPPSEQTFRLYVGTADVAIPYDEVSALNSDATAAARYWKKVSGF